MALLRLRQGGAMMRLRLDRTACLSEHRAKRIVHFGVRGVDRQRLPQRSFGAIRCTAGHLAQREVAQQPGLVWRVAERLGQHCLRCIGAMLIQQDIAEISERLDQRGVELQRLAVGCFGFLRASGRAQHHAKIRQDGRIRRDVDRAPQQRRGCCGVTLVELDQAKDVQCR